MSDLRILKPGTYINYWNSELNDYAQHYIVKNGIWNGYEGYHIIMTKGVGDATPDVGFIIPRVDEDCWRIPTKIHKVSDKMLAKLL